MQRLTLFLSACSRFALAGIFWLVARLFYDIEFHGLEHLPSRRPIYFAMAHKRDLDPIVELPTVLARQGWRALAHDVIFALRGDAFAPGFLARLVTQPDWFARFLWMLSLGDILRFLGIRPLEKLNLRPDEIWLRDFVSAEGDLAAGEVLSSTFLQHLSQASGEDAEILQASRLSHLLSWRYHALLQHSHSIDIFQSRWHRRMKNILLSQLKKQLVELTNWLEHHGSVWGAPEGQLSPSGKISPLSAILPRLLRSVSTPVTIVPIAIVYDFMTSRRMRIFVDVAPSIVYNSQLSAKDLNYDLRRAWLLSARFTCTQLASGFLVETSKVAVPIFTLSDLVLKLEEEAKRLHTRGRHVDPRLLTHKSVRKLAESFLTYAVQRHLVFRLAPDLYKVRPLNLSMDVPPGSTGYQQYPLAYAWNELQDMLSVEPHAQDSY